jgi:hypothetical protein
MRRIIALGAGLLLGAGSLLARAGGIGISFGAVITGQIVPGVYGRVVLGNAVPPPLVYSHPVMVAPVGPGIPVPAPLYLYVPPLQARHWRRYCHVYHACRRPVYFVSSPEYRRGFDLDRWRYEHPNWQRERAWERRRGPREYDRRHDDRRDHDRDRPHERAYRDERGQAHEQRHDHRDRGDDHDDRH